MSTPKRRSTTGHAILGLLALRPAWSTWELSTQLRRNMRFYWPRAESRIFAEARRLEEVGWARAKTTMVGRRARTTYSITRAGRAELHRWLATPPRGSSLESEPVLRFVLAELAKPEELRAALAQTRADAWAILEEGRAVAGQYLAGTAPFQDQVHIRAHLFDFLSNHALMLLDWAERAEVGIARWEQLAPPARDAAALELIRRCLARYPDPEDSSTGAQRQQRDSREGQDHSSEPRPRHRLTEEKAR